MHPAVLPNVVAMITEGQRAGVLWVFLFE